MRFASQGPMPRKAMCNRWLRNGGPRASVMCNPSDAPEGNVKDMEYGSIEREIHVDASPEVVFEVVSRPEHISEWWTDDADFEATSGAVGELVWGDRAQVAAITVVNVVPPRLFSFRWAYPSGKVEDSANSLLVTFEL